MVIIDITGLTGSGKTTIAQCLKRNLAGNNIHIEGNITKLLLNSVIQNKSYDHIILDDVNLRDKEDVLTGRMVVNLKLTLVS